MSNLSRRDFLKLAAAAAGAAAVPTIIPSKVWAGPGKPSEKITFGVIGSGIMGDRLRKLFSGFPESQVLGVCDVDPEIRARVGAQAPGVKLYSDFRELLARDDISAVVVATPHHSHAWITLAALKAGKDVYCEKPLTHTIHESRVITDAVRKFGRVLQVGTHRRARADNRLGAELVRNQKFGKLHTIRVQGRPGLTKDARPALPAEPIPDGFAWDLWLGPAPQAPFCGVHKKRQWDLFSDYSTGEITLTDCHIYDGMLWGAEPFLKGPVEIEGATDPEAHVAYRVTLKYASGVTMICDGTDAQPLSPGVKFEGTDGSIFLDVLRNKLTTTPETLRTTEFGPKDVRLLAVPTKGGNEWQACCEDFIRAVKARAEPLCPVEGGHRMTVLVDLVWIAARLGRKLKWDDEKEQFIGDDEANKLLQYEYRKPFAL